MNIIDKCTSKEEQITLILLARFLKQKSIYKTFLNYGNEFLNKNNGITFDNNHINNLSDFLLVLVNYQPQRLLSVFPWRATKEGFNYWDDMNNVEWAKIYNNIKFLKYDNSTRSKKINR